MKNNIKIGIGALILIALASTFFLFGGGSASTISVDGIEMEQRLESPIACETADTCDASLISSGIVTAKSLEESKQNYNIVCEQNLCVGVLK